MVTLEQRKYYFAGVIGEQEKFYDKNPARLYHDVFEIMKGLEGQQLIHAMNKMLYNGGHTTQFKDDKFGTAKEKMREYTDKIRQGFWDRHQYDIPPANEPRIT